MTLESADCATRPPGLDAPTVAAAFQTTAAAHPGADALRTKDDELSLSWGEYAERVRGVAAGLAALGVQRGDTVAIMLTNRPEFHFADTAAVHLGATPFSVYNTSAAEQIEYLVADAGSRVMFTERVLDPDVAPAFAQQHGVEDGTLTDLAAEPLIRAEIEAAVERGNAGLSRVEQVKRFELLPAEWAPGGDELTPTMKLKRRPIERKYAAEIERLYA